MFSWGTSSGGASSALGHGDLQPRPSPTKVEALSDHRIVRVACGDYHSVALTSSGALTPRREGMVELGTPTRFRVWQD